MINLDSFSRNSRTGFRYFRWFRWFIPIFVTETLIIASGQADQKGTQVMLSTEQLIQKVTGFDDAIYLRQDRGAVASLPANAMASRFKGLILGGPDKLDLRTESKLPTLLLLARSASRSRQLPWSDNAIVVASDMDGGDVYVAEAFPGDATKSPDDKTSPEEPAELNIPNDELSDENRAQLEQLGHGDTSGTAWLDFKQLLPFPWVSSRLTLRVFYFDQVSNPVVVNLGSNEQAPSSVSKEQAMELVRRIHSDRDPPSEFPIYQKTEETPSLKEPGVALNLKFSATTSGAKSIPAYGAIRLALSPGLIVPKSVASGFSDGSCEVPLPKAIIKAMILILVKNRNHPFRLPLEIPIWSDHELNPGDIAEAAFAVDLTEVLPQQFDPDIYCVYLLSGPYLAGPYSINP